MGMTKGFSTPSTLAKKAYEELFDTRLSASNIEALRELFPACRLGSRAAAMQGNDLGRIAAPTLVV
jgi:hypothetical protein